MVLNVFFALGTFSFRYLLYFIYLLEKLIQTVRRVVDALVTDEGRKVGGILFFY